MAERRLPSNPQNLNKLRTYKRNTKVVCPWRELASCALAVMGEPLARRGW